MIGFILIGLGEAIFLNKNSYKEKQIMNTENIKEKLKIKLKEIFQLEDLDLNFGIYRINKYEKEQL